MNKEIDKIMNIMNKYIYIQVLQIQRQSEDLNKSNFAIG